MIAWAISLIFAGLRFNSQLQCVELASSPEYEDRVRTSNRRASVVAYVLLNKLLDHVGLRDLSVGIVSKEIKLLYEHVKPVDLYTPSVIGEMTK
ncbi:hypothetical protein N9B23_02320 [bacterium]|nr:hypothetical protein [bacterium]